MWKEGLKPMNQTSKDDNFRRQFNLDVDSLILHGARWRK